MKSKKQIAIDILEKHKAKLNDLNNHNSTWYAMLSDLIAKYIGKESLLYNSASGWYSFAKRGSKDHLKEAHEIIDNAIDYINANDVKKETSIWRVLEAINQRILWSIITLICGALFWGGFEYAKFKQIHIVNELLIENQKFKDKLRSIPMNSSFEISKTKADSIVQK